MIKITITDDHLLSRSVTINHLTKAGCSIMAVTNTCRELLLMFTDNNLPDIAIIHYKTSRPETLMAAMWVKERYPSVKVIVTSLYDLYIPINKLRQAGVEGLVIKSQIELRHWVSIIDRVNNGGVVYP